MSTGLPVAEIHRLIPPAASAATLNTVAGGSTPAETWPIIEYDDTTDEFMDFLCRLSEDYAGNGLTVQIQWGATAITNNVVWQAAIRRHDADADPMTASHSYAFNTVTDAAPSAAEETVEALVTFTDGVDMDSLAAGEWFILRVGRDADNGSDNMSGDAKLLGVSIIET